MYKEVNPAIFTIVTFPFLFGVMFGDVMHGSLLTIFSIYLCLADKSPGTFAGNFASVRYLLLLMGIFATYCGIVYNDFTSIALQLFGPGCYETKPTGEDTSVGLPIDSDCIYPIGMDPIWFRSTGEITFMNSFKMKTSVIYGVA